MTRWGVIAAIWVMAVGVGTPGWAQGPPSTASSGQPDVLVLVYQQPGQADLVDITYAHTVPHAQAQRDLDALAKASGWAIGPSRVTDGSAPVQLKMPMTSSVFTFPGIVQNEAHTLPVEPFVTAFRAYKRLALIFSVGPGFQFQGQRDYADNNVQIALEQHGTVFTYQIKVLNPQFTHLNLTQSADTSGATSRRASPWVLFLGILAAATAAGVLVYALMARKGPPAPPRTNTDALPEEQTKIGTRG